MKCKICNSKNIEIIYQGLIRDGGLGQYTKEPVTMWKCDNCNAIWHETILETKGYYESQEYRKSLEGTSEEIDFYRLHDKESMDKFTYTGTTIFRNKTVADIGCGCGAFLDYVNGVANDVIAIEPSEAYRSIMDRKGFRTYAYACDVLVDLKNQVDVVTSFDVIEHVEDPNAFLKDIFNMLSDDGRAVIGTPTEAPVMRKLLGTDYEKKLLFSTQHLWILSEKSLKLMSQNIGFKDVKVKYYQRYGMDNLLGWVKDKEPKSEIKEDFLTDTLDNVWRSQLAEKGLADYIVLYLQK